MNTKQFEGHAMDSEHQVWCWSKYAEKNMESVEQYRATATLLNAASDLLAEVKRLTDVLTALKHDHKQLKGMVKAGDDITFCLGCEGPYFNDEGRECECCPFCQADDSYGLDFAESACADCRAEVADGHPSLSTWERNQ